MNTKHTALIQAFISGAERFPERTALTFSGHKLTFNELHIHSNKLANTILSTTNPKRKIAAVLSNKSQELYIGVLGILKASLGYVPLNPRFPLERTLKMIRQSGIEILIIGKVEDNYLNQILKAIEASIKIIVLDTQTAQALEVIPDDLKIMTVDESNELMPEITSADNDIAYLLFTSGSTGEPKGVAVSNANVTSYLSTINKEYTFTEEDRFSQIFDLTFDLPL